MSDAGWYRWDGTDLILVVRLQPRASKDEVVGPQGGSLKVRITAPPVEGKANARLVEYFSGLFKVPKSQVSLLSGETGRDKRLRISAPRQLPDFLPFAASDKPGSKG